MPLILIKNVKDYFIDDTDIPKVNLDDASRLSMYRLEVGDIVFSRVGSIGRMALVTEREKGWPISDQMLRLQLMRNDLDHKFMLYAISSEAALQAISLESVGSTRESINTEILRNLEFPLPPLSEQRAIAAYLDRETARIDALIAHKRDLLDLLERQRTALISHAVTKGLNPAAPMKDSGIPWLGEIPSHWDVRRLKFVASINPSKSEVSHLPDDTEVSFLPMERVGNGTLDLELTKPLKEIKQGFTYFRDGDVIVAKIAPSFENGKGALAFGLASGIGFGTTELHVIRATPLIERQFVYYLTLSHQFRGMGETQMYGTAGQKRVPDRFINDFPTPLPPLPEQRAIAEYLDRETAHIDRLKGEIEASIDLLGRYRAALISAAVTGKINVRGTLSS